MAQRKKIIIIGGGFAGLTLAKKLGNSSFDVLLIDKQNHHMFQPLFYQVASARLEPSNISFPFRKIFQRTCNVEFRLTTVTRIVPEQQTVETPIGSFHYDILVVATGCRTNYFGNELISTHALSMKTTQEAIEIRNRVLLNFENIISSQGNDLTPYMNIVIVGAGPTGVELAGSFAEMKNSILPKDYPRTDFSRLTVWLLEGSKNTLNSMSEESKKASRKYLEELGVTVRTETYVKSYDGEQVTLNSGETIPTKIVIWSAGVIANGIEGMPASAIVRGNRYKTNRQNLVAGTANIYALGDIACMETPLYPNGHPQLANVAINQAKLLAENLKAMESGRALKDYEYKDLGSMATIGKHKAVVDLPFIKFQGRLAWFVWMFLHLMLILSARNKLMIFINWAWSYLTKDTSLRLILKQEKK
ncbi:MAG: NAD(P)/FAD-dependent oxidoreductase [Bacteroidia bacterium]